jgi:hypothetical protein
MRKLDLPRGPFPPRAAPTPVAAAPVDPVDAVVLSRLEEPRVYRAGVKRIVRGRVAGGEAGRAALERRRHDPRDGVAPALSRAAR